VIDTIGVFTLDKFIDFLSSIDVFFAASTGPLHVSAALGTITIGLFPPIRPIFPSRWGTLGSKASYLVDGSETCTDCRNTKICKCVNRITPQTVQKKIESELLLHNKTQHLL
jgi:ADP-heptose:LPS heptosyltransferase